MASYLIQNGNIIDPKNKINTICDLLIENKKIKKIAKNIKVNRDCKIIDAKNKIVCPGLIDMHVHLREPGREDKETIKTAMEAAIAGGITSIVAMPNTTPQADNQTVIEYQLSEARKLNLINLYVTGKITKDDKKLAEMWEMQQQGVVGLTNDGSDVDNPSLYRHALEWAHTFGIPILVHAEIRELAGDGVMHEGEISTKLGLSGVPYSAQDLATQKSIILASEIGAQIHISHLSTGGEVSFLRQAKKNGLQISAEVTPHHFALTHEECLDWNTNAKINPPLREKKDLDLIIKGLRDDMIEVIASDHAPHLESEKMLAFDDAPHGSTGLETMLACVNTYLVKTKKLKLEKAIEKMTINPARILNIPHGHLDVGSEADLIIFDPEKEWVVSKDKFRSKSKNSVFLDKTLYGQVETVFARGVKKL